MSASPLIFVLQPNRDLIDANFDHYLLSNEPIVTRKRELSGKVEIKTPGASQIGFQQLKTFGAPEKLIVDRYYSTEELTICIVILESGEIISHSFDINSNVWSNPVEFTRIALAKEESTLPECLFFVDEDIALVSDGSGTLFVFKTGNRAKGDKWQNCGTLTPSSTHMPEGTPFIISDVLKQTTPNGPTEFNILLQSVVESEEKAKEKNGESKFIPLLTWINISPKACCSGTFEITQIRQVLSDSRFEFAAFDPNSNNVFIISGKPPVFIYDSLNSIMRTDASEVEMEVEASESIEKVEPIQEFGAENQVLSSEETAPPFNSEQLEECDEPEGTNLFAYWMNGTSHELIRITDLRTHQILFTTRLTANGPMSFAVRDDVDELIWTLNKDEEALKHQFTLQAFGYVQAGHEEKRFAGCSLNGDYATLVNRFNHAFIYFQKSPISEGCEMKNRKTRKVSSSISKQLILSLTQQDKDYNTRDMGNEFVGFHAGHKALFLLTRQAIYANVIKS